MNRIGRLTTLAWLVALAAPAVAQQRWVQTPGCPPPPCYPPATMPGTPTPPTEPSMPPVVPPPQPGATGDAFAQAPEGGTQPAASFNPAMFGDLIGVFNQRVIFVPSNASVSPGTKAVNGNRIAVIAPVANKATFKISENESPAPTDRVYFGYDLYSDVTRLTPGLAASDLHRETLGFEKTFLDGNASFGMRLPFQELIGDSNVQDYQVADLDLLFKYAIINNRTTGDVLSVGMVLTLPTGQATQIEGESSLNSTVLQPYVGWVLNFENWYLEGFTALAVPTDARDVTLFFNSLSAGYWLYRNNGPSVYLRGIVPVAELHLNSALNHQGLNTADPIGFPEDQLDATFGVHFVLPRATLGVAYCTPLSGPKTYTSEFAVDLTLHW